MSENFTAVAAQPRSLAPARMSMSTLRFFKTSKVSVGRCCNVAVIQFLSEIYISRWRRRRMTYYPIEDAVKVARGKYLTLTQMSLFLVQGSCKSCECMRAGLDIGVTEIIPPLSFPIRLIVLAVAAVSIAQSMPTAYAGFSLDGGSSVAVLYEGNGGKQLQYNNSNVAADVGIGGIGQAQLNGPGAINLDFSGAGNAAKCSSPCGVIAGVTIAGAISSRVSPVSSALTDLDSLSQTLGEETGTALTISSGGLVNAGSSKLDSSGNEVFTLKAANSFPKATFTVNGNSSRTVVTNAPAAVGNFAFNGSLVLTGGLVSDQVLFKLDQGSYGAFSGGATGTFLDPNGNIQINHSVLDGRIFVGGSQNSAIVSGANISFDPPARSATVPASLTLLGMALAGIAVALIRRWRRARLL
jgi:hypothetical protein